MLNFTKRPDLCVLRSNVPPGCQPVHGVPQGIRRLRLHHTPASAFFRNLQSLLQINFSDSKRHVVFSSQTVMNVKMMQFIPMSQNERFIYITRSVRMPDVPGQAEHPAFQQELNALSTVFVYAAATA